MRTDVVMPGSINRRRLAIEARSRRPLRKILCTSGYAESALIQDRRRDADALLPAKPCRKPDLAKDDPRRSGGLMRSQIVINAEITRRPKFARYQSSHQRSIEPSITTQRHGLWSLRWCNRLSRRVRSIAQRHRGIRSLWVVILRCNLTNR